MLKLCHSIEVGGRAVLIVEEGERLFRIFQRKSKVTNVAQIVVGEIHVCPVRRGIFGERFE